MSTPVTPAPGERGWARPLLALLAFLLLPSVPPLAAVLPITSTYVLLVPALAVCMLAGWWFGGPLLPALLWVGALVYLLFDVIPRLTAYGSLIWGWGILLAAAFGVVSLFDRRRRFFPRALLAVGLALVASSTVLLMRDGSAQRVRELVAQHDEQQIAAFVATMSAAEQQNPKAMHEWVKSLSVPGVSTIDDVVTKLYRPFSQLGLAVIPALLALESIAALALAWSLYHRLSRTRLGAPLGKWRDFRFSDQLVWGMIVGLTILLLPVTAPDLAGTMASLHGLGVNLLVFFGVIYALRGIGVLAWFVAPGGVLASVLLGILMLFILPLNVGAVLVGVGDTWFDWRRRTRPTS